MIRQNRATDHLYFAYGSNMNPQQISSRCFKPEICSIARLADYQLSFFGQSRRWDGGEATVVPKAGSDVWGVVYKLTLYDSERLDSWQDVRLDGTGAYFHYPTVVTDVADNEYPVLLYKRFLSGAHAAPSQEYMKTVISGAVDHGLPVEYLECLSAIETVRASFPVPVIFEHERSSTFGVKGCDCGI